LRGAFDRWRRDLRRRILEPVLVGNRTFRETVLNALAARGHLIYCEVAEGSFFVDPSDRVIASWMMWHDGWQREELAEAASALAAAGRLKSGAVFVDAGANIGTHTVYALKSGHFARAVSCEPEPRNARLLRMNIAANDIAANVTAIECALGGRDGQATLHLHPRNKGAHTVGTAAAVDGTQAITVPLKRLETVLTEAHIAPSDIGLVWIDVEGSEPDVIHGLGTYLGQAPLAVEHDPARRTPQERRAFHDLLSRHYTTLRPIGAGRGSARPIAALSDIKSVTDILIY